MWIPITLAVLLVVCLAVWITSSISAGSRRRLIASALLFLLLAVVVAPSLAVYCKLMTPLPSPAETLPELNGYDDILAANKLLPNNLIVDDGTFFPDRASETRLQDAVDEVSPALDRVMVGLAKLVREPIVGVVSRHQVDDLIWKRSIARAFGATAELSKRKGDFPMVSETYLDEVQYGVCLSTGGLVNRSVVGLIVAAGTYYDIYTLMQQGLVPDKAGMIERLGRIDSLFEAADSSLTRDRAWAQHTLGWHAHLYQILTGFTSRLSWYEHQFVEFHAKAWTATRLLQVELAIRLWREDHGIWPESLDELVPNYLKAVPIDPISPSNGSLRYVRTRDGFVAYSVGLNGIDDHGRLPEHVAINFYDLWTGDFTLKFMVGYETSSEADDNRDGDVIIEDEEN